MKVELILIPITTFSNKLYCYAVNDSSHLNFPSRLIPEDLCLTKTAQSILSCYFSQGQDEEFNAWLNSPRCNSRIIDSYDRKSANKSKNSIAIVRAIPIPETIACHSPHGWYEPNYLLSDSTKLTFDNKNFLKECMKLIPIWMKNTSFAFELMSQVFSIQELRLLVGVLLNQDVDPGNFHRRLKKLDILRPLGADGLQRIHRWEFAWERSGALSIEGLIP